MQPSVNSIDSADRFDAAIAAVHKRDPVTKDEWERLSGFERENAFTVAHVADADVLQSALDSIKQAVEWGTDFEAFKDECYEMLVEAWGGERGGHMENVFRTGLMSSYNEGRHSLMTAPAVKEARPYWRIDGTMDDRICDECAELHGTCLPADDPFWNTHYPPFHYQDRCTVSALTPEEAGEEGIDEEAPDMELEDDDFGQAPSAEGENWDFDLSRFDPELRGALEEKLREARDESDD